MHPLPPPSSSSKEIILSQNHEKLLQKFVIFNKIQTVFFNDTEKLDKIIIFLKNHEIQILIIWRSKIFPFCSIFSQMTENVTYNQTHFSHQHPSPLTTKMLDLKMIELKLFNTNFFEKFSYFNKTCSWWIFSKFHIKLHFFSIPLMIYFFLLGGKILSIFHQTFKKTWLNDFGSLKKLLLDQFLFRCSSRPSTKIMG